MLFAACGSNPQQEPVVSADAAPAGDFFVGTRPIYAQWVDMEELSAESDEVAGAEVADEGIAQLREINRNRKRVGRNFKRG